MPEIRKNTDETYELRLTAAEFRVLMSACGSAPADNGPKSHLYDAMWEAKIAADRAGLAPGDEITLHQPYGEYAKGRTLLVGVVAEESFVARAPYGTIVGLALSGEGIVWGRVG